jgi:hypothetical protein
VSGRDARGEAGEVARVREPAAYAVATANDPALWAWRSIWRREEQKIALALMVAFKVMMFDVVVQRPS